MEGVILFADDHIYSAERPERLLYESLRSDLPTLGVHSLELAEQAIKAIGSFKALVLDWQYSDDDTFEDIANELDEGRISIQTAQKEDAAYKFLLSKDFYSLIYIFSEKDIEEHYGEALRTKFGKRIRIKRKDENFTSGNVEQYKQEILADIQTWENENKNLSIPIQWSVAINESIQQIFKGLAEADTNWIKALYDAAESDGVDAEIFVIEILQLLLYETVVQNQPLIQSIDTIGKAEAEKVDAANYDTHCKSISKLFSRLFYSDLREGTPIMTGDVCELGNDTYGIIISPECDIRHIKSDADSEFELLIFQKNSFDDFLVKHKSYNRANEKYANLKDKRKDALRELFNQEMSRFHFLPAINNIDADCNKTCIIDFRSSTKRLKSDKVLALPRPFKINSPFIQQLRQRYLAHVGRIGTPALPVFVRDWNLV